MITTGDHDDRVVPLHSHKLTATLQHVLAGEPSHYNVLLLGSSAGPETGTSIGKDWHRAQCSPVSNPRHPPCCHFKPRRTQLAPAQPAADAHRSTGGARSRQAN